MGNVLSKGQISHPGFEFEKCGHGSEGVVRDG